MISSFFVMALILNGSIHAVTTTNQCLSTLYCRWFWVNSKMATNPIDFIYVCFRRSSNRSGNITSPYIVINDCVFRQHKLTVELKIEHELLDILLNIITQRDDKLSYEAIETLEKYLRLHVNFCVECCSNDCSHLKFVQNKFVGNNAIRMKIKSALMVCLIFFISIKDIIYAFWI